MTTLPLEDQLRSMILKNGTGQDAPQTQPRKQFAVKSSPTQTNNPHPAAGSAPLSQRPAPPQDRFPGRLPHDSQQRFHGDGRRGFHHGRGQSNAGQHRQDHPSTQAAPSGFNQHRQGNNHVPPHMRNQGIPPNYVQHQPELKSVPPSQNFQRFRMDPQHRGPPGSPTHFRGSMPSSNHQILSHQHPRGPTRGPGQPAAQLYDPYNQRQRFLEHQQKHASTQSNYLGQLATSLVPGVAMTDSELNLKLDFVDRLQRICQAEMSSMPDVPKLEFKCFGSIGTGFVTKGSDIDLAVVARNEDETESARKYGPRALEKIFLDNGFGARLLTNTRVPIIKFCERPSQELLENLRAERQKWDDLPEEEKAAILEGTDKSSEEDAAEAHNDADATPEASPGHTNNSNNRDTHGDATASKGVNTPQDKSPSEGNRPGIKKNHEDTTMPIDHDAKHLDGSQRGSADQTKREFRQEKPWLREKPLGPLDFPKDGVGILCDLNFAGHLGIYNTTLLHCYATSDQRVRDMVIFVKAWAKKRKINSSYNGTLSSYGYALMVLHYLMRVPNDPVIQDLQTPLSFANEAARPNLTDVVVDGHRVKFCGDEKYIQDMKQKGQWTKNRESLGALLRGFFSYYGRPGIPDRVGGFHWTRDVITFGQRNPRERMVTKSELGWTKARVEKNSKKEIRHRYLVCIQDPFELDHNVGRTVSHQGIVAIREEFRRAWRILEDVAHGRPHNDIFDSIEDDPPQPQFFGSNNNNSQQSDLRDDTNPRQGGPSVARNAAATENGGNAHGTSRRSHDPTPAEARAMAQKQGANASNANSPSHQM